MNTFKKIAFISLCGIQILATPAMSAWSGWEYFKPAKIEEKVREQIAKQEIGGSLKLLDIELLEGLGLAVQYRIESEPSYVDGFYTRIDKYSMTADVNPGDIIGDMDGPIYFNISRGGVVVFARQFKSQKDSLLARPYSLKHIPMTADKAIRNLNVGDYVGLEANLAFVLGLAGSSNSSGIDFGASTHAFISGKFFVQMFKMPDNKMRVKLISLNTKGVGADGKAKYGFDLDIVGLKFIENRVEKLVDFTPIRLGAEKSKNNVFMLDYVFDFNNPLAVQAYNDMMTKKLQFKELKPTNPLHDISKIQKEVLTDLSGVEQLSDEDRQNPPQQRRVNRLFKGTNQSVNKSSKIKLGINLLKFENNSNYARSQVTSYDRNNQVQKYILETATKRNRTKALFGLWGSDNINTASLLYLADDQFNPTQFVAFTSDKVRKEKELSENDFKGLQAQVALLIPRAEYNKIPWGLYDFDKNDKYVNSAYRITMFFHPEAVATLPKLSAEQFEQQFINYVKKTGGFNGHAKNQPRHSDRDSRRSLENYARDFKEVAAELVNTTNARLKGKERMLSFTNLRSIPVWEKKGLGFLISLLPSSSLDKLISFELHLSAKDAPTISHKFGKFDQEELYESLMYTQNVISNQGFDLRLWTDEDGEFREKQN